RQRELPADLARADAGVDQDQPVALGLEQHAMRDQRAAPPQALAEQEATGRGHRRAVEGMSADRHARSLAQTPRALAHRRAGPGSYWPGVVNVTSRYGSPSLIGASTMCIGFGWSGAASPSSHGAGGRCS